MWGEKFLPEPCGDRFTSQSKGLCYCLGARKTGLDLHQSKKNQPPLPNENTAGSTAGRVPVIPAPGREHSDLQGHKGLLVQRPGLEMDTSRIPVLQPFCPYLAVPSPVCSPPSPYREAMRLGRKRFPVPTPALLLTKCVTLGRSFHLPGLFLSTRRVLSCARDPLHFPVTITRGSALWSPYRHQAGEGSALPVYRLGRRGHSHLLPTIKVRSEAKNRPRSPVPTSCSALTTLGQRIHFVSQRVILTIHRNSAVSHAPTNIHLKPRGGGTLPNPRFTPSTRAEAEGARGAVGARIRAPRDPRYTTGSLGNAGELPEHRDAPPLHGQEQNGLRHPDGLELEFTPEAER